jgi:hypothetical protein
VRRHDAGTRRAPPDAANPDVTLAGLDPLQHDLQFGLAEHRPPGL